MLVPELDVHDLARSVRFYVSVLEFRVLFERPVERFAYLERQGAGNRQFVLADPDGYLWRPFQDLGERRAQS